MPVRSLNSSVIRWPRKKEVEKSLDEWTEKLTKKRGGVIRVGYFGSYARGNWGVGSDLDLIILLEESDEPFERRGVDFDTSEIPVPAELLVYTREEWEKMKEEEETFYKKVSEQIVWVYQNKLRASR